MDAWDQFETFERACAFIKQQIKNKQYKPFWFADNWASIMHKFITINAKLNARKAESGTTLVEPHQAKKILVATQLNNDCDLSSSIFEFTNRMVIEVSRTDLPPSIIRATISQITQLIKRGTYVATSSHC